MGAVGGGIVVTPKADLTAAVRRRLEGQAVSRRRLLPAAGAGIRGLRLGWRAALVLVVAFLALLVATPQGRAVISHVFRFAGIELHQGAGPTSCLLPHPGARGARPARRSRGQRPRAGGVPVLPPDAGRPGADR